MVKQQPLWLHAQTSGVCYSSWSCRFVFVYLLLCVAVVCCLLLLYLFLCSCLLAHTTTNTQGHPVAEDECLQLLVKSSKQFTAIGVEGTLARAVDRGTKQRELKIAIMEIKELRFIHVVLWEIVLNYAFWVGLCWLIVDFVTICNVGWLFQHNFVLSPACWEITPKYWAIKLRISNVNTHAVLRRTFVCQIVHKQKHGHCAKDFSRDSVGVSASFD